MKITLETTIVLLLFCCYTFAQPGALDLSFNQTDLGSGNIANGPIKATSIQSDGKIIIGGSFTNYNGNAINRIARLNTDGSLDNTFNIGIGPNYDVNDISIQSDGKIIIGGSFTLFNGFPKVGVVRLNIDGTLDNSFNNNNLVGPAEPTTVNTNQVFSTSIQSDGKIIIGGILRFQLNSPAYYKIARLNTNGSLDTSFNITLQGHPVYTTSIQSDGKIIIGGSFSSPNGVTSYLISRLNTDGTIDNTFNVGTGPNNVVNTTSIQADGKIIIGGNFTSFNGISRNRIARLNTNGTLDSSFITGNVANINVLTTCIQSDGKIIIGGASNTYGIARLNTDGTDDTSFNLPISTGIFNVNTAAIQNDGKIIIGQGSGDGVPVKNVFRLNTNGTIDSLFDFISGGANDEVYITSIQSDGKIIIGGDFTSINGITKNRIARLNSNGTLDTSFNPGTGFDAYIKTISIQSDGKIIIGGDFTSFNGIARNRIARLNTNGTLDTTFSPGTGANSGVYTTSIQSDGKIIIGGDFISFNGNARFRIARLNTDGTLDTSFSSGTGANGMVYTTSIQSDGKIIIGGVFSSFNGNTRVKIARLNANGTLDNTFYQPTVISASGNNNFVSNVSIQSDGKIIAVGRFISTFDNISRNGIYRLNTNGTLDTTFDPGTGTGTNALNHPFTSSIQSDGKIIVVGSFTSYNGISRNCIARLNTNGTLDTTFNIGTGLNGLVRTISIQNDGKIIIGGDFTSYNGTGKNRIARINESSTLAPTLAPTGNTNQTFCSSATITNLTATGSAIKWYPAASGGTALVNTTTLVNGTAYYASQTVNGIESTSRLAVTVSITNTAAPTGNATQSFCSSATIADLTATGTEIRWYSTATGLTAFANTAYLVNGTAYYASQTSNGCESSSRLAVNVIVTNTAAPAGSATQNLEIGSTLSNIIVTGTAIKWYTSATGGDALSYTTVLVNDGVYYASQTLNSCESQSRLMVKVTLISFSLPFNNFAIETKSETCATKNNGQIIITASQTNNYTTTINGKNYNFVNNGLTVSDLPPGVYSFCIGITGKTFQQCYSVNIGKGGSITGKSSFSSNKALVEITSGTAPFEILVNGKPQFETSETNFSVDIKQGDLLEVKTAIACEGIYAKNILDGLVGVKIYPNPTAGLFEITIPTSKTEVEVELYSIGSQLISKRKYPIINERIQLSLEKESNGIYFAKINLDSPLSLTIIKKS